MISTLVPSVTRRVTAAAYVSATIGSTTASNAAGQGCPGAP